MDTLPVGNRLVLPDTWQQCGVEWPSGEEKRLVCCRVIDETHDVKTFLFTTEEGLPFRYEPGQFVTITVNVQGQRVSRCYTVSSPPTRPYTFSITVKRVPGGVVSNWLHDHLQVGHTLQATGPAGDFTAPSHPAEKLLYLSAGSGITPTMSMLRSSIDLGQDLDIVFVHSARTPKDIVFRQELSLLSHLSARLRVIHVCESFGDERDWSGLLGRLSLDTLAQYVPDYREREVFVCGPGGYMQAVQALLLQGGHDPKRYHQESFNIDVAPPASEVPAVSKADGDAAVKSFTVRLTKSQKEFQLEAGRTVLSGVKQAGCAIATSCQQGVCGSCKTLLVEGNVQMKHQGGIRQREVDKGWRLLCCSYPESDLVLDL